MKKHIKPVGVFLFLFAIISILIIISYLFPPGGLRIGKDTHLHFPGPEEILRPVQPDYADISYLLDAAETDSDILAPVYSEESLPLTNREVKHSDSLFPGPGIEENEEHPAGYTVFAGEADEDILRDLIFPIEVPPGNDTVMDIFFSELSKLQKSEILLRIMHYGDSQIENDRISSVLRNRFQSRFGGTGIGMFPVVAAVPHSAAVRIITDGNWSRHSPVGRAGHTSEHNRYGLLMSYSEITPVPGEDVEGSFSFGPTTAGYHRSRQMKELSIFMGHNKKPFLMEISSSGEVIDTELYFPSDSLILSRWDLPENKDQYSVSFTGDGSPEIYSVSLDNNTGVAVNNVPLRGSSGLEFSITDSSVLRQMMEELNVRLVLLQFGVNVVPHITDDYTYYENALRRQLKFLKSVAPEISGIVIGVSDMSRRVPGGYYESYPNIELIRDAQRSAAFSEGFAFWDIYRAMGGKNSMPAWVNADPPLAQLDHIHFTFRGSSLVGDLLFTAIMDGYDDYLKRLQKQSQ